MGMGHGEDSKDLIHKHLSKGLQTVYGLFTAIKGFHAQRVDPSQLHHARCDL